MTERADQFDERDQLEGIEPTVGEDAGASASASEHGPDALGAPDSGQPA
ncbi:MAG TPA: hypothetical protein VFH23_00990 [Jiangellaceae bacterium]|nr:hypothetical protein [Jiangellaceae bacterium]